VDGKMFQIAQKVSICEERYREIPKKELI